MKNKSMVKYKENFISKIRKFFKKIFGKKEEYTYVQEDNLKEEIQIDLQNTFMDDIKVDENIVNNFIEKGNFLKQIDGNEEMLNMLSIDRLQKLEKYYDSVIEKNNEKIKRLKESA